MFCGNGRVCNPNKIRANCGSNDDCNKKQSILYTMILKQHNYINLSKNKMLSLWKLIVVSGMVNGKVVTYASIDGDSSSPTFSLLSYLIGLYMNINDIKKYNTIPLL